MGTAKRRPGVIEKISYIAALVGGAGVVAMMLLVFVSVLMRYLFDRPFTFTEEVTGYLVTFSVFMGLAYTLYTEGHIRTDILLRKLSPRAARWCYIVGGLAALGWACVMAYAVALRTFSYFTAGTRSFTGLQTPLWIPATFMLLGSALLVVQLVVWLVGVLSGRQANLSMPEESSR